MVSKLITITFAKFNNGIMQCVTEVVFESRTDTQEKLRELAKEHNAFQIFDVRGNTLWMKYYIVTKGHDTWKEFNSSCDGSPVGWDSVDTSTPKED
jgi:hypothetical protein